MFRTQDELKEQFRGRFRRFPRDDAWDQVTEDGLVDDVLRAVVEHEQEEALEYLFSRIRTFENRFARKEQGPRQTRRALALDRRAKAKAAIQVLEAARLPEVVCFRKEILQDQLVNPQNVQSWIERNAKE